MLQVFDEMAPECAFCTKNHGNQGIQGSLPFSALDRNYSMALCVPYPISVTCNSFAEPWLVEYDPGEHPLHEEVPAQHRSATNKT